MADVVFTVADVKRVADDLSHYTNGQNEDVAHSVKELILNWIVIRCRVYLSM